MDTQDAAQHQFFVLRARRRDHRFGILDVGGDRLFHEHMAAGVERLQRVFGMAVFGQELIDTASGLASFSAWSKSS